MGELLLDMPVRDIQKRIEKHYATSLNISRSDPLETSDAEKKDEIAIKDRLVLLNRVADETNEFAIAEIAKLNNVLERLEKNPDDYLKLCMKEGAEATIEQIENFEDKTKALWERYSSIAERHQDIPATYLKINIVVDHLYDIIAMLQEIRWKFMILHSERQPTSGKVYESAEDLLAALRS